MQVVFNTGLLTVTSIGSYISLQKQQQVKSTNWSNTLKSQAVCNSSNIAVFDAAKYYAKGIKLLCLSVHFKKEEFSVFENSLFWQEVLSRLISSIEETSGMHEYNTSCCALVKNFDAY